MKAESRLDTLVLTLHLAALAFALAPPVYYAAVVARSVFKVLPTRDLAGAVQCPIISQTFVFAELSF